MVWTLLNLMLSRGLTMKRWNNFPRVEDVSMMDNIGFVLHVALFLSHLEEEKWAKIDKLFLIKKIIFSSLNRLVLSDINSGTRDYITSLDSEIFAQLEEKALWKIFELEWSEELKKDIQVTLNENTKSLENKIILAAKKYAGYIECSMNHRVYTEVYENILIEMQSELNEQAWELGSLKELLNNGGYKKYLLHIRGLSQSMRWNQDKRDFPISVMAHLVYVTFISYIIWTLENITGSNLDVEELLLRSIYHDIPEAITWDFITPTKRAIPGFVEILEKVELQMMDDYLFCYVSENYKQEMFKYMLEPFDDEYGKTAKYADVISALFEAKIEVNYWNLHFKPVYLDIKKKVNNFGLYSTDYIVKFWMDQFDEERKLFV